MSIEIYSTPVEDPILTGVSIVTCRELSPFRYMDPVMLEELLSGSPHKDLICNGPTVVLGKRKPASICANQEITSTLRATSPSPVGGDVLEESIRSLQITSSNTHDTEEDDYESFIMRKKDWIDVRCEPVIDFLHAQVFTQTHHTHLEVYGEIYLIDLNGRNKFPAYDRDRFESPQHLYSPANFLQLSGPEEIPTLNQPVAYVDIKNVDTGDVIAHGQQTLLKSTHHAADDLEQLFTLKFQAAGEGSSSHLELKCAAFTFGVYAKVRTFLFKDSGPETQEKDKDEDEEDGVEIFGLIYAQCNPLLDGKDKYKCHLFNVVKQEHEWVGVEGGQIVLSKSLVAVPAYSELEISLDLWASEDADFEDDGFRVQGTVCFQPSNYDDGYKDVPAGNGYYVRVDVTWHEPSLLNKPYCKEGLIAGFRSLPRSPKLYASHLLEVFSLFISRPDGKEVNLHGSVSIYDSDGWCNIFSRSKEEAYFLSRGCNLLPMQGPKRAVIPGMMFFIAVDLSDIDGHFKIKGSAHSSVGIDERQRPWYDRRHCSLVKNEEEKSFAAVHYTLFSFAVQAIVRVLVRVPVYVKIYGDIIASCGELSYSTIYDKQFFRRVLFTRKEANSLGVEGYIELSRNLVAVPMTSSLLAEVCLSFQTVEGTHHVEEIVEFQNCDERRQMHIESGGVYIFFDVKWKFHPFV